MKHYVGIDLGTTNTAICTYDGEDVRVWKSPEQHSVTPSAIFVDKRSRYYGARAHRMAVNTPERVILRFKRLMGTITPIQVPTLGLTMSPEECSAEILKLVFSYLPEEIRNGTETCSVVTVPAAFNQMQKDATLCAAEMAGIGSVALMQEPVAAVMSVMRLRQSDGMFLIYDLGGGTFDIALAESIGGHVNLLSHGGIPMCGGSDFDRLIVDNLVKPWLLQNFKLPADFPANHKYQKLFRLGSWAAEEAKIRLSAKEETTISMPETEIQTEDESGNPIYFDIHISRTAFDPLIRERIRQTIEATRQVLKEASLHNDNIDRIVFVGGPTQYEPLRKFVSSELGISGDTKVDPMTAVAEGAAIFAESIDWQNTKRPRKSNRGSISSGGTLELSFEYIARTPELRSRIVARCRGQVLKGTTFQVDSMETGWSSGRIGLFDGASLTASLAKNGENRFKVFVFDPQGGSISLPQDVITVTRTLASIDAIPASHSLGIQVKERLGGQTHVLDYLVRKGDHLPAKGQRRYKAETALRPNGPGALVFQVWEGDIEEPITDNFPVGAFRITGNDIDTGVIEPGAELVCDYEISDSGKISIAVTVPSIGVSFKKTDFYSRQTAQMDFSKEGSRVMHESEIMLKRIDSLAEKVDDPRLSMAREKLIDAQQNAGTVEPEQVKQAYEDIQGIKSMLAKLRKEHLNTVRDTELQSIVNVFDTVARQYAKPGEITAFDQARKTAERYISDASSRFEDSLQTMQDIVWAVIMRQEWFIVDRFRDWAEKPQLFRDKLQHAELVAQGMEALKTDDAERLRQILFTMNEIRIFADSEISVSEVVNILKG